MHIKNFIIILITILTLVTVVLGIKHPSLHKHTMFSDEYHKFEEVELSNTNLNITLVESESNAEPVKIISKKQNQPKKTINKNKIQNSEKSTKKGCQQNKIKKETKQISNNVQPREQTNKTQEVKIQPKQNQNIKPQENMAHQLSEQEEIIAWNRWRSNLQNQVMKDAPVRAPIGTVFKFSFTVDKKGNMSNIKVWSENPNYTNLGITVIKPVLVGYAHKPILEFPQGTKRNITNVRGGYVISTKTKYSRPDDYSDYEKVKL